MILYDIFNVLVNALFFCTYISKNEQFQVLNRCERTQKLGHEVNYVLRLLLQFVPTSSERQERGVLLVITKKKRAVNNFFSLQPSGLQHS